MKPPSQTYRVKRHPHLGHQTKKTNHKKNKTKKRSFVFKETAYNSGEGMLTSVWGPSMWHVLHTMSFNYPVLPTPDDKDHYRDFIENLKHILPCRYCRENVTLNLKQYPLTMDALADRAHFSRYIYDLHERVNKRLGKKNTLTYADVRERYEHFRSRCLLNSLQVRPNVEKGCTEPIYGNKTKCVLKVIPQDRKETSFQVDKLCLRRKEGIKERTV